MVNLAALTHDVFKELQDFNVEVIMPDLKDVGQGGLQDVLNTQDSLYYQWLACLMRVMKPKQVVELGGAMGVSALCMVSQLPEESKLYSITLEEDGKEFSFIKTNYPQLTTVVGDDLDLSNWPADLDFGKTDLMFVDSEHTAEQVRAELELYMPKLKEGTVVLFDDIKMPELYPVWLSITASQKLDLSVLHHSGFGAIVI